MIVDSIKTNSKNVIFSMFQENNAWTFVKDNQKQEKFYQRNLDEIIKIQKQYARIIGADYYFYKGDLVKLVKSKFPQLIELNYFVQYYDFAKFIIMSQLCKKYNKVIYLDTDMIPVTKDSIFNYFAADNSLYIHWFYDKTCPFYKDMVKFINGIKDIKYKYDGHTNTGIIGANGTVIKQLFKRNFNDINMFIKEVSSLYSDCIGFEHIFMYLKGRNKIKFNLKHFPEMGWDLYACTDPNDKDFSMINDDNIRILHVCGVKAKEKFEKNKETLRKIVKSTIGDYNEIK